MVTLGDARPPEGMRLYAVGDIHGEQEQLLDIRERIARDLDARPVADWREIYVGDYVDRGPENAAVIETLAHAPGAERRVCLLGNHDVFMRDFLAEGAPSVLWQWLTNGGTITCANYGVDAIGETSAPRLHAQLSAAVPAAHRRFLDGLECQARFGDFGFVHAGIRPGVPWAAQDADDLIWIREAFLRHRGPHELVVVHGHTPSPRIEVRENRIGIDTGAGKGGVVSAMVIEDGTLAQLTPKGRVPLDGSRAA